MLRSPTVSSSVLNSYNKTLEYYQSYYKTPQTKRIQEIIDTDEIKEKPSEVKAFAKVISKQVDEFNEIKLKKQVL